MGETHAITVEKVLPYVPEKIWRTLTTGELVARWLMPNDFVASVGHRFTFRTRPMGDWDGIVSCEVLACDPPKLFGSGSVQFLADRPVVFEGEQLRRVALDGGAFLRLGSIRS